MFGNAKPLGDVVIYFVKNISFRTYH